MPVYVLQKRAMISSFLFLLWYEILLSPWGDIIFCRWNPIIMTDIAVQINICKKMTLMRWYPLFKTKIKQIINPCGKEEEQ